MYGAYGFYLHETCDGRWKWLCWAPHGGLDGYVDTEGAARMAIAEAYVKLQDRELCR